MKTWEPKLLDFIDKVDNEEELSQDDLDDFVDNTLGPMIEDYKNLETNMLDLIDTNFELYDEFLVNVPERYKNTKLYTTIKKILETQKRKEVLQ